MLPTLELQQRKSLVLTTLITKPSSAPMRPHSPNRYRWTDVLSAWISHRALILRYRMKETELYAYIVVNWHNGKNLSRIRQWLIPILVDLVTVLRPCQMTTILKVVSYLFADRCVVEVRTILCCVSASNYQNKLLLLTIKCTANLTRLRWNYISLLLYNVKN